MALHNGVDADHAQAAEEDVQYLSAPASQWNDGHRTLVEPDPRIRFGLQTNFRRNPTGPQPATFGWLTPLVRRQQDEINMSMIGNFLQLSSEQLAALIADPSSVETLIHPEDEECDNGIDVDKAWHGIHYLLADDAWGGEPPLANVVLGGTEIGDDVGYGPARYLTVDEVCAAADALKDITPDVLRSKYVASELSENDIYPEIWDDPDDDAVGYLASWYQTLRDYYMDAAAKRNAMLKYLN